MPKSKQTTAETPQAETLAETCVVCDRVRWGDYQPLGFGLWRHRECNAGSPSWLEAQRLKPASKRSPIYKHYAAS